MQQNESKIFVKQALNPNLRTFNLSFKATQKLHAKNHQFQVVDFVDYFGRVTIEWE